MRSGKSKLLIMAAIIAVLSIDIFTINSARSATAKDKFIAAMNDNCIKPLRDNFSKLSKQLNRAEKSRPEFIKVRRELGLFEKELQALIKLRPHGVEGIRKHCACKTSYMMSLIPERGKYLGGKLITTGALSKKEQDEYVRSMTALGDEQELRKTLMHKCNPFGKPKGAVTKSGTSPSATPPNNGSVEQKLTNLKNLLEKGLITKDEAAAKRKAILDAM